MTDLLSKLVSYLSLHASLTAGTSAFYNEMPDGPAVCLVVQEEQTSLHVPAQINAEIHRVKFTTRAKGNEDAQALAQLCWRWLLTDNPAYDTDKSIDTTGIISITSKEMITVVLLGNPVWEKADQQGRKYYCFYAHIITPR